MPAANESLDTLVCSIYEAALQPARWPEVLRAMNLHFSAESACIFLHDFVDASTRSDVPDATLAVIEGIDASAWAAYVEHFCSVNVWTQNEDTLTPGIAVTSSMLYPDSLLPRTEFHADWLRQQDLFYALGGVLDRQGTVALKTSLLRAKDHGPYTAEAIATWQRLIPHLQRAADLHRRLSAAGQRAADAESALSMLPYGVLLLTPNTTVRSTNAAADALLRQRRGLGIDRSGRLVADSSDANRLLRRHLSVALNPSQMAEADATGTRLMRFRGDGGSVHASIAPLPARSERLAVTATAVVFLVDPDAKPRDFAANLQTLYRLTPAEARLTCALAGGKSLQQHADARGLSINTVRTHLKSAAAKVGAKRQADLVRVVLTGLAALQVRGEPRSE